MTLTDFLNDAKENENDDSPIIEIMAETLGQSQATQPSYFPISRVSTVNAYSDRVHELQNRIEELERNLSALETQVLENLNDRVSTQTVLSRRLDIIERQLMSINDLN